MEENGLQLHPGSAYQQQLEKEPVLPTDDIQGDVLLGFNKTYSIELVLDVLPSATQSQLKKWLQDNVIPHVTSASDVLKHRAEFRGRYEEYTGPAFINVSFSFVALQRLLSGTSFEGSLSQFDDLSAFVIGSRWRAGFVGDDVKDWEFGSGGNDIFINIAADRKDKLLDIKSKIIDEELVKVSHEVVAFRGIKGSDVYYGHEHFGFQDGLSQPEVRGSFVLDGKKDFVVKRLISPDDSRFQDYSRPGFRLIDTGKFLLGYEDGKYPDWCANGTFVVFRKLEQDVFGFWEMLTDHARNMLTDAAEEEVRKLAGELAAKCVGRWWDGTPLILGKPLTGLNYPPEVGDEIEAKKIIALKSGASGLEGLKNGFQYTLPERPWPVIGKGLVPKDGSKYESDALGFVCPFGAHIRKVQPRDVFTDIGTDEDTLKHRVIRRGNNFGTRVKNVFRRQEEEDMGKRGLSLVMYAASIERQFEFLQRQWANTNDRPVSGGDDMIIGQPSGRERTLDVLVGDRKTISTGERFVTSRGMGYFLLPSISTLKDVLAGGEE